MTTETSTRVLEISEGQGRLVITAVDTLEVAVRGAADAPSFNTHGVAQLRQVQGDLEITVPFGTTVAITQHEGDVQLAGLETVRMRDVFGSISAEHTDLLVVERDSLRENLRDWLRRLRGTRRNLSVRDVREVHAAQVGSDLLVERAEIVEAGAVGGSAIVVSVTKQLTIDAVGGSCEVRDCVGNVALGDIGGSVQIGGVSGALDLRNVGGSADIRGASAVHSLGNIGGRLQLEDTLLSNERDVRLNVGGSARIELAQEANVTVEAMVGGGLVWPLGRSGPGMHRVRFGNGESRLSITVGGKLTIVTR